MGYDVTALGELLIDFTENGQSGQGNTLFEANPGGAPCNVLAMLARLGRRTAFIGKVGGDSFGRLLRDTIVAAGIDDTGLALDDQVNTTLAFVQTAPDGDRDFSFFRNPGADTQLRPQELRPELLQNSRIFHFGSLSLTHSPAREATAAALDMAQQAGALISFDPNLRPPLWASLGKAKEQILWGIGHCQLLKIAEEELAFVTGEESIAQGQTALRRRYPSLRLVLVTCGKEGSWAFYRDMAVFQPAYPVKAIDTTGAGDTFCGCCLHSVLEYGIDNLTKEQLSHMLSFANAAAGLVTTKKGAIRSMPLPEEIAALMKTRDR